MSLISSSQYDDSKSSIDYLPDTTLNIIFEFSDFQTGFHGIRLVNRHISKLYALTSFKFNISVKNIESFIKLFPNIKICCTNDYKNLKLLTNIEELYLDTYLSSNEYIDFIDYYNYHHIVELFISPNKINKISFITNKSDLLADYFSEYRNFLLLLMDKHVIFNNITNKTSDYLEDLSIDTIMTKYKCAKNLDSIITQFLEYKEKDAVYDDIYKKTYDFIINSIYENDDITFESFNEMISLKIVEISLDVEYKYIDDNLDEIVFDILARVSPKFCYNNKYVFESVNQFISNRKKKELSITKTLIDKFIVKNLSYIIRLYHLNYVIDNLTKIIELYPKIKYIKDSIIIFTKNKITQNIIVKKEDIDQYLLHNMPYYEILSESDLVIENLDQILRFKKVFRHEIIQYINFRKSKYNLDELYISKFDITVLEFQKLVLVRTEICEKFEEFCSMYTFGDLQELDNISEILSDEIIMLKSPAFKNNVFNNVDTIIRNYIESNIISNHEYVQQKYEHIQQVIFNHVINLPEKQYTLRKQVLFDMINSEIYKSLCNIVITK
jgi:hypothetical protein